MTATAIEKTVLVPVHIPERCVRRLIDEALAASDYWCEVTSRHDLHAVLRVLDGEGQCFNTAVLSDQAIERGLRLLSYERVELLAAVIGDSDDETYAQAADMFLQFAVFGTIIYS